MIVKISNFHFHLLIKGLALLAPICLTSGTRGPNKPIVISAISTNEKQIKTEILVAPTTMETNERGKSLHQLQAQQPIRTEQQRHGIQLHSFGKIIYKEADAGSGISSTEKNVGAVRIFNDESFQVTSEVIFIHYNQCVELPHEWINRITFIDTLGLCVLLWDGTNCSGNHKLLPADDGDTESSTTTINYSRLMRIEPKVSSIELC